MVYTEHARKNLLREGIHPSKIIKTGSPMPEIINKNLTKILKSKILERLGIEKNNYILLSSHREENLDNKVNFINLIKFISKLKKLDKKIVLSMHPRFKKKLLKSDKIKNLSRFVLINKPFFIH